MNSKIKSLALMTAMMAMGQPIPSVESVIISKKDTSHLRKKCKSCKSFPCSDSRHKRRLNPKAQACEKHQHR